ncbi:MAG: metallophosphoesterase [Candidatus Hydrogenedentes bacterium]|nr:metallophosphoesterase [Candidatus Hydrogenedentota bacterium]
MRLLSRRAFLGLTAAGAPTLLAVDAFGVEPGWLRIRHLRRNENPTHRFVHFTDLHHKGDRARLRKVIDCVNGLSPDFVCFTGDIVEDKHYLDETLEEMTRIETPMYGCPGNHDYWSGIDFRSVAKAFESTGGAWLLNEAREIVPGEIGVYGAKELRPKSRIEIDAPKTIFLGHYPESALNLGGRQFTLLLAGHSHGGQVRLPFVGALVVPNDCGEFDRGLFETPAGPLYVNPGIGTWLIPVRFMCRPEITVFEF